MKYVPLDDDLAEILPEEKSGDPRAWELELREWVIRQAIFSTLPPRQAQVVFLCWEFFDPGRPAGTTRAVAERLGISPRAVREHCRKAASNPDFRGALGF
jgi:DNA-directed RNA polymerase specialized sigma24 family protein